MSPVARLASSKPCRMAPVPIFDRCRLEAPDPAFQPGCVGGGDGHPHVGFVLVVVVV